MSDDAKFLMFILIVCLWSSCSKIEKLESETSVLKARLQKLEGK